jgi:hypothetical protein
MRLAALRLVSIAAVNTAAAGRCLCRAEYYCPEPPGFQLEAFNPSNSSHHGQALAVVYPLISGIRFEEGLASQRWSA